MSCNNICIVLSLGSKRLPYSKTRNYINSANYLIKFTLKKLENYIITTGICNIINDIKHTFCTYVNICSSIPYILHNTLVCYVKYLYRLYFLYSVCRCGVSRLMALGVWTSSPVWAAFCRRCCLATLASGDKITAILTSQALDHIQTSFCVSFLSCVVQGAEAASCLRSFATTGSWRAQCERCELPWQQDGLVDKECGSERFGEEAWTGVWESGVFRSSSCPEYWNYNATCSR